jgi:membrane carboxypeptidase/penicillin-binding protein
MREALKGVPEYRRPMPDGVVPLRISRETGALVSNENPDGMTELFESDHLPAASEASSTTPAAGDGQGAAPGSIF